ncbi:hypothetical protein [Staphylococcus epidermidis]
MAGITKEQVLEFVRNNDLDWDESYPRSDWWKFRDERDAYNKQRDELINDMAEVKKKAKAFDEIVEIYNDIDNFSDSELMDAIEDKINDLEVDHEG